MPGMSRRRLLLSAEPDRLGRFDSADALAGAQQRLRELRDDVELTYIEPYPPDSIGVVLFVQSSITDGDLNAVVEALRDILGIGPGETSLIPEDDIRGVRGIGGVGATCEACGQTGGTHRPGCPNG